MCACPQGLGWCWNEVGVKERLRNEPVTGASLYIFCMIFDIPLSLPGTNLSPAGRKRVLPSLDFELIFTFLFTNLKW